MMDAGKLIASILAFFIPVVIPNVHMYILTKSWGDLTPVVDRFNCSCSCWDNIFQGPHQDPTLHDYKHLYFNCDKNMLKIWVITVSGIIFLYESCRILFFNLWSNKLRWSMGVLLVTSMYSHYFAWWNHWNFWNDDFYTMWYSQLFFTVTGLVSTILVLGYLDVNRAIVPIPMLVVSCIAIFHLYRIILKQFVIAIKGRGHGQNQVIRDVPLILTYVCHAVLPFLEVTIYASKKGVPLVSLLAHRNNLSVVLVVISILYFCVLLLPY